ncbi:Hypothetical protein R9X50_00765200 [Acrodontium crateriforme]|uniref:Uncharacterized protein n=1 Tax=Acrodontium crateriforme TaxID=150365 RepID=A0AAQ3ME26_9PEZI|nr:Hypothetical protein R9X50_00765200 [Acrodontium crateriforme]
MSTSVCRSPGISTPPSFFNTFTKSSLSLLALSSFAVAAPAKNLAYGSSSTSCESWSVAASSGEAINQSGNEPGYANADAPFGRYTPSELTAVPTIFGPDSIIPAIETAVPTGREPDAAPPQRSSIVTGPTTHRPYEGTPTNTGAVANEPAGIAILVLPPNPTAAYYNTNGKLQNQEPIPYQPAGGLGANGSEARYMVESDFNYDSITLGLYKEWIELDLFNNGLAIFLEDEFIAACLTSEDRSLVQSIPQQEQGHATLSSNMLGPTAPSQCKYNYPFSDVREFVEFNQILTGWGESGVWGFINHLDSREVGQLMAQSIAIEARQEMIFR